MSKVTKHPISVTRFIILKPIGSIDYEIDICNNCVKSFIQSIGDKTGYSTKFTLEWGTCEICRENTQHKHKHIKSIKKG